MFLTTHFLGISNLQINEIRTKFKVKCHQLANYLLNKELG